MKWLAAILPKFAKLAALWVATVLVHLWLIVEANLSPMTMPFSDVSLYEYWADNVLRGQGLLGVNVPWVYPFVALGPMLIAKLISANTGMLAGWLILIGLINLISLSVLVGWGRGTKSTFRAAGYYLAFLTLLGPVAIGRIDAAATGMAIFGLVHFYRDRLRSAIAFFTLGAWLKIWPVAAVLAVFASTKSKLQMVITATASTIAVLGLGVALGANESLLSFVSMQSSRGLQVESVAATFWVWATKLGLPGAGIYFDNQLVTNQVSGAFANEVSGLLGLVMAGAIGITALLGLRAYKKGANSKQLFGLVFLTAVLDLIVFNKVGSPQFELWLAVPIMAGILLSLPNWRLPIVLGAAIAGFTNLIYPVFYLDVLAAGSLGVWLLTIRNVALVALLVWANLRLSKLAD